ncbi:MAG: Ig-like domain-containing protein [Deltaproteobacteria bacterium]|nr:Ig-like domain-containing protein [Deltaproteobacteria bacterium]
MTRRSSPSPARALALLALLGGGCGSPVALDVVLVPDPNTTNPETLVGLLRTVRLVVDSAEGLYPATTQWSEGDVRVSDVDGDGAGELEAQVPLESLGRLPFVRLERGGLPPQPLDLRVEGLAGTSGESLAAGGVQGAAFLDGSTRRIEVPFNLKPLFRPPQVTQVIPPDGAKQLAARLTGSVFVIFSKRMRAPILSSRGVVRVLKVVGGREEEVPPESIVVQFLGPGPEAPTTLEYRFAEPLALASTYRIRVTTDALDDAAGRPLDQVPIAPGNQPFVSQFTTADQEPMASCPGCEPRFCHNGGEACPPGLTCDASRKTCRPEPGPCVPECAAGLACDPAQGVCLSDCRLHGTFGGCPTKAPLCGTDGLCRAPR